MLNIGIVFAGIERTMLLTHDCRSTKLSKNVEASQIVEIRIRYIEIGN